MNLSLLEKEKTKIEPMSNSSRIFRNYYLCRTASFNKNAPATRFAAGAWLTNHGKWLVEVALRTSLFFKVPSIMFLNLKS